MSHKLEHLPGECADAALRFGASAPLSAEEVSQAKLFPQRREVRRRRKRRSPTRLRLLQRGASLRRWAAPLRRQSATWVFAACFVSARRGNCRIGHEPR